MPGSLRRTPLHERHAAAGARLVPFAGWEMPLLYKSIVAEHRAVRQGAGLFDVSHMGQVRLHGGDAVALAQRLFTNRIAEAPLGRVRYGLLCSEDGGVVDDVTAYRVEGDEVLFCVNAANLEQDLTWIGRVRAAGNFACEIRDESAATVLLALQGPKALELAHRVVDDDEPPPRRWRFREAEIAGTPVWLSRTGYTGEDGYELYAPAQAATELWDRLRAVGGEELVPAGLGARDTLRTEMAFPLYGHELDRERDPIAAGLERFVAFGAGFVGEPALRRIAETGPALRLVGLVGEGRRVPRPGSPIVAEEEVGVVTSGTFGPSVERPIAIGYVPSPYAACGTRLAVELRGRRVAYTVVETPFFRRKS